MKSKEDLLYIYVHIFIADDAIGHILGAFTRFGATKLSAMIVIAKKIEIDIV